MLTLQQTDLELKIIWNLRGDSAEDLIGFSKINAIEEGSPLESCSFYFVGEKVILTIVWRALVSSLKTLLDRNVQIRFICTSPTIEERLRSFGFSLLGTITCDPAAKNLSAGSLSKVNTEIETPATFQQLH